MSHTANKIHIFSEWIEWLEHRTKPLFVIVALVLYIWSLITLTREYSPITELDQYLVGALSNLSIPFGVILLQEMLELVTNIAESNLLSARRQFEIVLLVIVRSFFKKFAKVSDYVGRGEFGEPVQEAAVKIVALLVIFVLVFAFRHISRSDELHDYKSGQETNVYKQILVAFLIIFILVNMIFINGNFDDTEFIRLAFTAIIIVDAIFLLLAIFGDRNFLVLAFESSLIIALIFARFPLFTTNVLSVSMSVIGVSLATLALYIMFRVAQYNPSEVDVHDELMGHSHPHEVKA